LLTLLRRRPDASMTTVGLLSNGPHHASRQRYALQDAERRCP
jgi:hypothetical protein